VITSVQNPKVQWVRRLQAQARLRREEGLFVVEGLRLADELLRAGWPARLVLHTADLGEPGRQTAARLAAGGAALEAVAPHVMEAASDTRAPQGLLVVAAMQSLPLPARLDFVLVLDELRDPGNLGAILRAAAAAGVQAVFLGGESVDPFAPKVLRAAMGAHFRLPIRAMDWDVLRDTLGQAGLQPFLAEAGAGLPYTQADFRQPLALLVGGEAHGPGAAARRLEAAGVHIPMPGGTESLNAAVAAAILIFEVVRQRATPDLKD
jgi:TrmH family RNA methyltransferase